MQRLEVIHELVDELRNRDFSQIAVRFVPDQPHREDVAQRRRDEMRILADEQFQPSREIFIGRHSDDCAELTPSRKARCFSR